MTSTDNAIYITKYRINVYKRDTVIVVPDRRT